MPTANPLYDLAKIDAWNTANPAAAGAPALLEVTAKGELHFNGEDYFFGNTMVIGGTDGNDKLLAGNADDDTVWGDGGNDTIDGGGGNDILFGGKGDDFITDQAGDNVAHGDEGNDTIMMGKGIDTIFGGDRQRPISSPVAARLGRCAVPAATSSSAAKAPTRSRATRATTGSTAAAEYRSQDLAARTAATTSWRRWFAHRRPAALYGNDVLLGGVGTVMKGFGGDDIMLGFGGFDKFIRRHRFRLGLFRTRDPGHQRRHEPQRVRLPAVPA